MFIVTEYAALKLANSADSDEMQHYAAFHLGLHCLPEYLFWGFQNRYSELANSEDPVSNRQLNFTFENEV